MDRQWKSTQNNVPGIQTSKGEPGVVKALQKLWKKLHLLEQAYHPNEELCSKETQTSDKGMIAENSVADTQYKLLKLQLQYLRNTLVKVIDETETDNGEESENYNTKPLALYSEDNKSNAPCSLDHCHNHLESWSDDIPVKIAAVAQSECKSQNSEISHLSEVPLEIYPRHEKSNSSYSQENRHKCTQTSPIDNPVTNAWILQPVGKYGNTENNYGVDLPLELQIKHPKSTSKSKSSQVQNQKIQREFPLGYQQLTSTSKKSSKQTHYHLKLTDVPFIIGASTAASHSLIANVQNIIAMMKAHNKGLCSSATHLERKCGTSTDPQKIDHKKFSRANSNPDMSAHQQDIRNILNNLVGDLIDLTVKHETLKQKLKDAQDSKHKSDIQKEGYDISKHMESKAKQIASLQKVLIMEGNKESYHRRCRSLSESSANKCEVLNKQKEKNEVNKYEQKCKCQLSHNVRYNESGSNRRKLMLELKQFQFHLQQEDIFWN